MLRAACYARFSSDLQRDTSIADQLAVARQYAEAHGWTVLDAHIYTDAALSASSLDRPGIQALLAAVVVTPRPFDVVLVDDSSRVARDLADAVRFMQRLKFYGARAIYISQNIDSDHEQAETLVAVHGIVDSLYLAEMSKKTKRGLAGQIARGYATGGRTYGYRTVPVVDESGKKDSRGNPALVGKRVEIHAGEARTIVQIFDWFAAGLGVRRIVERLNAERIAGPRGGRWKHNAVRRILSNEKFTGKLIWGQRRHERQPGSRHRLARPVARAQWHILERPDLRIVDAALWARAQQRHAEILEGLAPAERGRGLMRGRNAALHSPHLFSGFLRCEACGGSVVIVSGGKGNPRYGCLQAARNGSTACSNRLTIRAALADERLLGALTRELRKPALLKSVTDAVSAELNRRLHDRPRLEAEIRAARHDASQRLQRLVRAIEEGAPPQSVTAAIREREAELNALEAQLAALDEPLADRLAVMPTWVRTQLADLAGLLRESPARAKAEFRRLRLGVTLRVVRDEGPRPFYRARARADLPWLAGSTDFPVSAVACSRR